MLAAAGRSRIVTLDIPGKPWTTEQLAVQLEAWKLDGRDVACWWVARRGSPRVQGCRGTELVALALTLPHPWCGCWWPRASTAPGASPPITLITESDPCRP